MVHERAKVYDNVVITGSAKVYGDAKVSDSADISGHANVYGTVIINNIIRIEARSDVSSSLHYLLIGPIGSRNDYTTFSKSKDGKIFVACGCFNGTLEEFEKAVKKTHKGTYHEKVYMDAITFVKRTFS